MSDPRGPRALAPLLATLLALALAALALAPLAGASGYPDYIAVTTDYVTVGAPFTVQITLATHPQQQSIVLRVERAASTNAPPPTPQSCATDHPFPGLAPVSIAGSAEVHLRWPATLGPGDYGLCATSAADGSYLAATLGPFPVLPPGVTPTPTPTPPVTAQFEKGATEFHEGDTLDLDVSNWPAALTAGPTNVLINTVGGNEGFSEKAVFVASQDGPVTFLLSITLPSYLPQGNYAAAIYSGAVLVVQSDPFFVAAPQATPATQIAPTSGTLINPPDDNAAYSPLIIAVAALLALAVALLVRPALAGRTARRR